MKKGKETPSNNTINTLKNKRYKVAPLSRNDLRVLDLLLNGRYSAIDLTTILNIPDPRSNIRYLRNAGYEIGDYWTNGKFARYKIYFAK